MVGVQRNPARRQTKFLFCHIVLELLRSSLRTASIPTDWGTLTDAITAMVQAEKETDAAASWKSLCEYAAQEVDEYANSSNTDENAYALVNEEDFKRHGNLNTFLKTPQLGKATGPRLILEVVRTANRDFNRTRRDGENLGQMVASVAKQIGEG